MKAAEDLLPLRLPAILALAPAAPAAAGPVLTETEMTQATPPVPIVRRYDGGPVEFDRVVPASGNSRSPDGSSGSDRTAPEPR